MMMEINIKKSKRGNFIDKYDKYVEKNLCKYVLGLIFVLLGLYYSR